MLLYSEHCKQPYTFTHETLRIHLLATGTSHQKIFRKFKLKEAFDSDCMNHSEKAYGLCYCVFNHNISI